MNDTLIQNMDLLDEQALRRQPEFIQYKADLNSRRNALQKRNCLHVDFSIHQCIQADFVGEMPQRHVKMLDHERTQDLIQNEEQGKSVNLRQ
jgi:hypothetical protein